jgi:hypothetical protein
MDEENGQPTKPEADSPTPEVAQLLKLLEAQSAMLRTRAPGMPTAFQGASFRYGSLVAIMVFALGSVGVMEWMVSSLPRPKHAATGSPTPGKVSEVEKAKP